MSEYYEKINWDINFQKYIDLLIKHGIPSATSSNLIIRATDIFHIIPEVNRLNQLLKDKQYKIVSASIVNTNPNIFGGIHVDKTQSNRPLQLRLNIPIENSTSMVNRWYDISNTPYSVIDWDYQPKAMTEGDKWFLTNSEKMVNEYCLDSLILEGPTFFKSSVPHNVDGRYSSVRRRILSILFSNSTLNRIADWDERKTILECINNI